MIALILFCWIGLKLSAPLWFYVLAGVGFAFRFAEAAKDS
jgi:hypothetical protein